MPFRLSDNRQIASRKYPGHIHVASDGLDQHPYVDAETGTFLKMAHTGSVMHKENK
jgi:hypothetical protein